MPVVRAMYQLAAVIVTVPIIVITTTTTLIYHTVTDLSVLGE